MPTNTGSDESRAASRVLALLEVSDLATLRDRVGKLSVEQTADLLLPAVAALSAVEEDAVTDSDQAAVGVVLFQCLIRQRLAGRSLQAVIEQVMAGETKRPRELERSIPRAVEKIIMRTLRKRSEERFASMHDLGMALLPFASETVQRSYAAQFGPSIAPVRRGARRDATDEELAERRARRRNDLKTIAGALIVVVPLALIALRSEHKLEPRDEPAPAPASAPAAETSVAPTAEIRPTPAAETNSRSAPKTPSTPALAAARAHEEPSPEAHRAAAADREAASERDTPVTRATRTYAVDVTADPTTAWLMLDHKPAGSGRLRRTLPVDGKEHALHVGAPGYRVKALRFKDSPPPRTVVLEPSAK